MDQEFHHQSYTESQSRRPVLCVLRSRLRCPTRRCTWPILFLSYTADALIIAARHGVSAHAYADDTVHITADNCLTVFGRLTSCVNEITDWMTLGTSHQLAKVDVSIFVVSGAAIDLLHSVTCLVVSIDAYVCRSHQNSRMSLLLLD